MTIKAMFYLGGIIIILKGILLLLGINMPKRDGTLAEDILVYGYKNIGIGIAIIVITYILSKYYNHLKE